MGMSERIVPAVAFASAFAALFYVLGGVAAPFIVGVTAPAYAVVGFASALGIALNDTGAK